jgi:hypothetical protein
MIFKNDKIYTVAKWCVTVVLPALLACYIAISKVWGWPYSEEIAATAAAVIACLATILGIGSMRYAKLNDTNEA